MQGVAIDGSESLVHPNSIIIHCSTRFYAIFLIYITNRASSDLLSPALGKAEAAGRKLSLSALIA